MTTQRARSGRSRGALLLVAVLSVLAPHAAGAASARRVVVIKSDGLPYDAVERAVRERNPRTGKSMLPWIEKVFFQGGTRMSSFYVRGMSLSGPSWSLLDTGRHLQIKGNAELDRYTSHSYDYLNFFPFWLATAAGRRADMWGTSVLDDLGIPLLIDAYPFDERYQSFQLYQRGSRFSTLIDGVQKRFTTRTARQLVDEWYLGIEVRDMLTDQLERELVEKLKDPRVRYLDYYTTDFDHAAHHNNDRPTHLHSLQELDAVVGRIWTAISRTPEAADTVLVLLSDHGVNTDERVYSQGFNLVTLLAGDAGGNHHVITKRRMMKDYSIKGIYDPIVPLITTSADGSRYLNDQSDSYPTAFVDFDGNERASIHLRESALNMLQILLQQLQRRDVPAPMRRAIVDGALRIIDDNRERWQAVASGLDEELGALHHALYERRATLPLPPPDRRTRAREEVVPETPEAQQARIRATGQVESWTLDLQEYSQYVHTLDRLLALTREEIEAPVLRIEELIAPRAMGERNALFDLRHYVVGPASGGLTLAPDGSLDFEKSFARVDYFALLHAQRAKNNVQPAVTNKPVDFTAVRLPCASFESPDAAGAGTCVWLDGGHGAEALLLGRQDADGSLLLRYMPVTALTQDARGTVTFAAAEWRAGLPLNLMEDPQLAVPAHHRRAWLDTWHTDREWLEATHRTRYSNAIVGLHENFGHHETPSLDLAAPGLTDDERLLRRLRVRQRAIAEPDILVLAADHWNFDVRGFNPGGNHGSFFRPSTHATLMVAGGERTGVPRGLDVQRPYDSLSFLPTVLRLTGAMDEKGQISADLASKGFDALPGRPIEELFGGAYLRAIETLPEKDVKDRIAPPSAP